MKRLFCGLGVAAVLVLGIALGSEMSAAAGKAIYDNPVEPKMTPDLNVGRLNYDRFCAACHGRTARGTDKGPTFISRIYHPGHHGDQAFFIAPKNGARAHHWPFGDMKPVPGVNDALLSTILQYVRAVQKANGVF
jgi:hypothetical protein